MPRRFPFRGKNGDISDFLNGLEGIQREILPAISSRKAKNFKLLAMHYFVKPLRSSRTWGKSCLLQATPSPPWIVSTPFQSVNAPPASEMMG